MSIQPTFFILAGGRGERLWPLSTATHPKPFLPLFEGKTLLEWTLERVQGLTTPVRIFIVTTEALRTLVQQTLPDLPPAQILCEPQARNTAAAMAWICGHLRQQAPQGIGVVLPADHLIRDVATFQTAIRTACELAQTRHQIVTLGIHPTRPATEYGYIACGQTLVTTPVCAKAGIGFTEKPDEVTAKTYLNAGNFLWNAGIFIWRADVLEAQFRSHAPTFYPLIDAPEAATEHYSAVPAIAFDYAIMEPCEAFTVVEGTFDWDDVGSYPALLRHLPCDAENNRAHGPVRFAQATGCTVLSTIPNHTVIVAHTTDLFVAQTPSTTVICPASEAHRIAQWMPSEPPTPQTGEMNA